MKYTAFVILLLVLLLGTVALYGGTRSMTDIKGPIAVVGTILLALVIAWRLGAPESAVVPEGIGRFTTAVAVYVSYMALSVLWASHTWVVKYEIADHGLYLLLAVCTAVVAADRSLWKAAAAFYVILGAVTAAFSLVWHTFISYLRAFPVRDTDLALQNFLSHGFNVHYFADGKPALGDAAALASASTVRALHTLNDMRAPLGNANLLAAFLVIPIGLACAFIWREVRGKERAGVITGLALSLALMLSVFALCRPKSYAIGLFVFAAVFLMLRAPFSLTGGEAAKSRKGLLGARQWLLIGLVSTLLAMVGTAGLWKAGGIQRVVESKSYLVRAELWRRAAVMITEKPIFGWGAGNYFTDNQPAAALNALTMVTYYEGGAKHYEPMHNVPANADSNAHNEYLQHATDGGVIGLSLYLLILASAFAAALAARRRGFAEPVLLDALIAVVAALAFTNIMNPEVHFPDFAPHFWVVVGLLVAARGTLGTRTLPVPQLARIALAVAVTVLSVYGIRKLAVEDYISSRDFYQAEILTDSGQYAKSAALYAEGADLTWDQVLRVRCLWGAGYAYRQSGDYDNAVKSFATLSDEIIALASAERLLGDLYERQGDCKEALRHYEIHKKCHPEDAAETDKRIEVVTAILARQGAAAK